MMYSGWINHFKRVAPYAVTVGAAVWSHREHLERHVKERHDTRVAGNLRQACECARLLKRQELLHDFCSIYGHRHKYGEFLGLLKDLELKSDEEIWSRFHLAFQQCRFSEAANIARVMRIYDVADAEKASGLFEDEAS